MRRHSEMLISTWTGHPKYLNGDLSKESFKRFYDEWGKQVPATCPADTLLIFDVKQGWEPLCKFLGMPIPNVSFPNTNDANEMKRRILKLNLAGYALFLTVILLLVGVLYLFDRMVNLNDLSFFGFIVLGVLVSTFLTRSK
jgi:hypothetical protein